MQSELALDSPFAGIFAGDSQDFGDGLQVDHPDADRVDTAIWSSHEGENSEESKQ
jgi:hypothetical protein